MINKLLCKLSIHDWRELYGLHLDGYANYQCAVCGAKRIFPVKWDKQVITKSKTLKGSK